MTTAVMIFGMTAIMSFDMLVAGTAMLLICNVSSATIKTGTKMNAKITFFNTFATSKFIPDFSFKNVEVLPKSAEAPSETNLANT